MNPGLFPLILLAAAAIAVTVAWPRFWIPNELPFDEDDATRGDWEQIPSQGHSPDTD
jgi:hypothetical protein